MFSSVLWMRISVLAEAADRLELTPIDSLSGKSDRFDFASFSNPIQFVMPQSNPMVIHTIP